MALCNSIDPVKEYNGRNVDTMPTLLADGRIPMSVSQLMKYRISESERFPDWKNFYFDTSDLLVYSSKGEGKVKFVLTVDKNGKITNKGRNGLELINPNSKLNSGAIELTPAQYSSLNGIEVETGNLGITENRLTQDEILGNKIWRILARHPDEVSAKFAEDPNLLKEYVGWVKSQTGEDRNMAVYVNSLSASPKLRVWYVNRLVNRSDAGGGSNLGDDLGRFVGIAPEAQNAKIARPTLEQSLNIINQNLDGLEIRRK